MIDEVQCGLNHLTQKKILQIFESYHKIDKVILYGSRAKGNFKPGSDIDITMISSNMTLSELLRIENQIDDLLLPFKVDLSLYHLIDNPNVIDHIDRLGIVWFSRA